MRFVKGHFQFSCVISVLKDLRECLMAAKVILMEIMEIRMKIDILF